MTKEEKEMLVELLTKAINREVFYIEKESDIICQQKCSVFIDDDEDVIMKEKY